MATDDDVTLGFYLDRHADRFPDREAITDGRISLSYGELLRQVETCAKAMIAGGLQAGDRVAVLSPPRTEALVTFLAAAKLGLLWLGLNPRYRLPELEYVVSDSRPTVLFGVRHFEQRDYHSDIVALRERSESIRRWIGFEGGDGPYELSFAAWLKTADRIDERELRSRSSSVEADAAALLVYTSGSSGKPKGVMLRQRELLRRSRTQNAQFPVKPYPKIMNPLPINHIGGMHFLSLYTFVGGGTIILSERYRPEAFIEALEHGSVNAIYVLPTMFQLLVNTPGFKPALLDQLQWVIYSGAAMPKELVDMLFAAKCQVGLTYGMTETCGSVTYAKKSGDNRDVMTHTIGRSTPVGEVRIQHEEGRPSLPGETGEIQVRAEYCMGGYFNRPDATKAAYSEDGWLKTGDIALLRADGNIEFVGRMSEMYKSGGYNVYPREIELALETHPDVELSAVIGVPDPLFAEIGWAYVIVRKESSLGPEALKAWCSGRLANYKVPKRFIVASTLPMLPVGKVDKVRLKAEARAGCEAQRLGS